MVLIDCLIRRGVHLTSGGNVDEEEGFHFQVTDEH